MKHILDNPAWNALVSGNKQLANGEADVRFFDKEVSPFVAFKDAAKPGFQSLYEQINHDRPLLYLSTVEISIPDIWKTLNVIKGFQMVCDTAIKKEPKSISLTPLSTEHVPQMLALTKLTNPGPFGSRTIEFGHYNGVFENNDLVAMAGQRMNPFEYAEVSAVCTHPGHLGKGYARQLLTHQIDRMQAASNTPFLHVRHDNERAVKVYQSLGFKIRTEVYFYVLAKTNIKGVSLI